MRTFKGVGAVVLCLGWTVAAARGGESYFRIPVDELRKANTPTTQPVEMAAMHMTARAMDVRVILDGPGEAFWTDDQNPPEAPNAAPHGGYVDIRVPAARDVSGRLILPDEDGSHMTAMKFTLPAAQGNADGEKAFDIDLMRHDVMFVTAQAAGSAWFRHDARLAATRAGVDPAEARAPWQRAGTQADPLDDTVALFSGGRALSESLQLDRKLINAGGKGDETVDISTLGGIDVPAMDWSKLIAGKKPALDPLAGAVPFDQHAIFFPTFASVLKLADDSDRWSVLALQAADNRSEDASTRQRYERQLGLSLDALGRLLGPKLIASVAVTGSDPYLRVGSDIAVLLQPRDGVGPQMLQQMLLAKIKLSAAQIPGAVQTHGDAAGLSFDAEQTPDRSLSSFLAIAGDVVVLTNSKAQLERLGAAKSGKSAALASQPEYVFFRDRYKLGEDDEQALIVLSDATIRRWCSPRWRIADSRRTRAAAVLDDLQAENVSELVAGVKTSRPLKTDLSENLGELMLTARGALSSTYGTLDFMTPIIELPMDKVTTAEAATYGRWRDSYQRDWQNYFDPIAIRVSAHGNQLGADLTVMPLILGTEYASLQSITQGVQLAPDAGDPHDALEEVILALNPQSQFLQQNANMAQNLAPGVNINPLSWVGHSVALYIDDDPFWDDLAAAKDQDQFVESHLSRIPIGLRIEVANGLKLAGFLAAAHAFVDQSAPQMTVWENFTYRDRSYVKISPTEQAKGHDESLKESSLCYVADGQSLLITPNEALLKRAIDRQLAAAAAATQPAATQPAAPAWLGESLCMRSKMRLLELLLRMSTVGYQSAMQHLAWSNLPILNEWKHLFPDQDPVQVHQRLFGVTLHDPVGGTYVWNEQWQTMESTTYGHPAEPKDGPGLPSGFAGVKFVDFGLTFEDQGLRARAAVDRNEDHKPGN